jgi:tRNA-(ms[2]io[6]A)-hydroxylase
MTREVPWSHAREGLPLVFATPPAWAEVAVDGIDALLVDHAHCEHKAASTAMALIGRFPERAGLVREMLGVAHEEMRHFRQVLDRIERRGGRLTAPRPDRYVRALREVGFRRRGGIGALGDLLLVSALVEARSCERFRLLAEALSHDSGRRDLPYADRDDLGTFYRRLAGAEARHWETFRDLAYEAEGQAVVDARLGELSAAEGAIVASRPLEPRMH